jgi:TRAP-type uncharacterized transport system fused permease subunit
MFRKWSPWALCALISLMALINLGSFIAQPPENANLIRLASAAAWTIFPVVFGLVAALILSRQPDNSIGWLLIITHLVLEVSLPAGNYLEQSNLQLALSYLPSLSPLCSLPSAGAFRR